MLSFRESIANTSEQGKLIVVVKWLNVIKCIWKKERKKEKRRRRRRKWWCWIFL